MRQNTVTLNPYISSSIGPILKISTVLELSKSGESLKS